MKLSNHWIIFFLSALLVSCQRDACEANWLKHENKHFTLCYPKTWSADDSGVFDAELILIHSGTNVKVDLGRNINIIKQNKAHFPEIKTLQEYADFSKNQIFEYLEAPKIKFFKAYNFSNIESYKLVMTAMQNGRDLFFEQYFFKYENNFYVITFTTTASDKDTALKNEARKIIESIQLLEK